MRSKTCSAKISDIHPFLTKGLTMAGLTKRKQASPGLAGFPQPARQGFFKSSLGLRVGLGVFRAHRQPPKAQSRQISAYRALMKFDAENHLDPTREIHPPPTHDTVSLWVRTVLDPSRQLRHLIGCEPFCHVDERRHLLIYCYYYILSWCLRKNSLIYRVLLHMLLHMLTINIRCPNVFLRAAEWCRNDTP